MTRVTGEPRVLAVIGGLHLLHAGTERLERTTEALAAYTIPYVYPCHCTGDDAVAWLTQRLGSKLQPGYAGMKIGF